MKSHSLAERALAQLQELHKLSELVLVHSAQIVDPGTGESVHDFVAVSRADPNGPSHRVILGADGSPRERLPGPDQLTRTGFPDLFSGHCDVHS